MEQNNGFFVPAGDLSDHPNRPNAHRQPTQPQQPTSAPYNQRFPAYTNPNPRSAPPTPPRPPYSPNGYRPPVPNPAPQPPKKKSSGSGWVIVAVCASLLAAVIGFFRPQYEGPSIIPSAKDADDRIAELFSEPDFSGSTVDEQCRQAEQLLDELYDQGLLADEAEYNPQHNLFTFTYADGMLGGICLEEFDDALNSGGTTTRPSGDTLYSAYSGEGLHALFLNGFEDEPFRVDYYHTLCREWAGLGVTTTLDFDITVADLLQLSQYDIVVFSMHGNEYDGLPVLCLDERVNGATDREYYRYLYNDKSIAKVYCTDNQHHYWVFPKFFTNNYGSTALDGKVFFSETCKFYGCNCSEASYDTAFSDALLSRGAECVIGYHNSVGANYSRNVMKYTLEQMFEGVAAQAALQSAIGVYGINDNWNEPESDKYPAYPLLHGNGSTIMTAEAPAQYPSQRELFDETYWSWSVGPTLGTNYFCRFHSDGTFEFISMGALDLSTGTYSYRDGVLTIDSAETYNYVDTGGFSSQHTYYSGMMEDYIHFTLTPSTKDQWDFWYQKHLELYAPTETTRGEDVYTGAYTGDGTYYYSVICEPFYDGRNFDIYVCGTYREASYWASQSHPATLAKISYSAFYDVTDIVFIESIQKNPDGTVTAHTRDVDTGFETDYVFSGDTVRLTSPYGETITGTGAAISYAQRMQIPLADNCAFINDEQLTHEQISRQSAISILQSKCREGCCYVTFTTKNGQIAELVIAFIP